MPNNRIAHALSPTPMPVPRPVPGRGETTAYTIESGDLEFEHSSTGLRGTLSFIVEDLAGAGPRVLIEALRAPGVPQMDTPWPGIDTLLPRSRRVTNVDGCTSKWKIVVTYGFPEVSGGPFDQPPTDQNRPVLEIDSAIVIKRTGWAYAEVTYPGGAHMPSPWSGQRAIRIQDYRPLEYSDSGVILDLADTPAPAQGGMVDVPVVVTTVRLRRRELPVDSRGRAIIDKIGSYTGKTNSRIIGGPHYPGVRTWLVSRIGAETDDGGASYNMTYELLHNVDTWDARTLYIDPATGQPGDGIGFDPNHPKNGVKDWRVTEMADLHELDLYI